ncbi:MAG: VOC family protein [Ilumatobacteraceae bacterium]
MLRLRQVALVAHELEPSFDELHTRLQLEVAHRDPAVGAFGLHNVVLPVGNQFLEIVAPTREGTAAGRYLERRRGDGGYMIILQCDDHAPVKQRVEQLGVRTALAQDTDEYRLLQLHPADTGGTFLEIDQQLAAGGDDPWYPAGEDWERARRTDIVTGIAGATVQSERVEELASRGGPPSSTARDRGWFRAHDPTGSGLDQIRGAARRPRRRARRRHLRPRRRRLGPHTVRRRRHAVRRQLTPTASTDVAQVRRSSAGGPARKRTSVPTGRCPRGTAGRLIGGEILRSICA